MLKNNFILLSSFMVLLFQDIISSYIPLFRYYDELLCVTIFLRFIIIILRQNFIIKIHKYNLKILICIFTLIIIGISANVLYKFQAWKYVGIDIISCTKVFLLYIGMQYIQIDIKKIKNNMINISKLLIIIMFIFGIFNLFFDIGMGYDIRYGIKSYKFILGNPGTVVIITLLLIAILETEYKKNKLYIILGLIIMCMTLRALGIAMVGIYIVMKIFLQGRKKMSITTWIIIVIVGLLFGIIQINDYFLSEEATPRSILLQTSIKIAKDYFPIGTGFGTYGSDVTKGSYTKLYYDYNINSYWGLSKEHAQYLTDNYWPMIIAQFGYIGVIVMIIILYYIYKFIKLNSNNKNKVGLYLIFIYILISSIAAQLLAHPLGVMAMLIIFYLLQFQEQN